MPSYIKRQWEEPRGDQYDVWGHSWWYFEVEEDGTVLRQIEQYDSGIVLKYSARHVQDDYGGLAEKPLDIEQFGESFISAQEFESAWMKLNARNTDK